MRKTRGAVHVVIPDTQVKPGTPTQHLDWIGRYIVGQFAGRENVKVIHLGDHWHMDSLSSYEKGKKSMEGRRIQLDIDAGNAAFDILCKPMEDYNAERKAWKEKQWWPERHFLLGNHEDRISRAVENDATLEGFLSLDLLNAADHGWQVHPFLEPVELDGVSYCAAPHHKVLTTDLEWKPLGDIKAGETIYGFDEFATGTRKFKTAEVLAADPATADLYRVTLGTGRTFDVTSDHVWLARKYGTSQWHWVSTCDLDGRYEVCQASPVWDTATGYEAGWLAGILDGEGHISKPGKKQGGIQLAFAQNPGQVLDRATGILDRFNVPYSVHNTNHGCMSVLIRGTSFEKAALIGSLGAGRLIDNTSPEMFGRVQQNGTPCENRIVSVEPIGRGEIVMVKTTTNTMLLDGYAHHNCHYFYNPNTGKPYGGLADTRLKNIGHSFVMGHQQGLQMAMRSFLGERQRAIVAGSCYLHDETYRGPQANDEWRGILVLHEVEDGDFDIMEVSLNYLSWRYTGKPVSEWMTGVVE